MHDYFEAHPEIDEHLKNSITADIAAIALTFDKNIFMPNHNNSMNTTFVFYFDRFGELNVDYVGEVDTKKSIHLLPCLH